jgi:integrase/recombinase XerC/integrase/recombinase XerD
MHAVSTVVSRRISYLSREQVERFFRVIPPENVRDWIMFDLIYRYGLRRRELALIRLADLSEGRIWITRVKRGISGAYPIYPRTRKRLWRYLAQRGSGGSPYLIATRQSGTRPISPSTVYAIFRRYAALAELPDEHRHVHVLRHSIAVHLMNVGWDVADVQDWLGHVNIASTMVYATITNKRRDAAYRRAVRSREIAST